MTNPNADHYALARFLTARCKANGWSLMDIEKRSGGLVKKANAGKLLKGPLTRPVEPETQVGLARALGVPERTIQRYVALAAAMVPADPEPEVFSDIRDRLAEMSEADQMVVADLVDAYYQGHRKAATA